MESRYIGELDHTVFCKNSENMTVINIATQIITKDHTYFRQISPNQNVTYHTFFWNAFILIGFLIVVMELITKITQSMEKCTFNNILIIRTKIKKSLK